MTAEHTLQKLHQMLEQGQSEGAVALIAETSALFADDPRALVPLLDSLDRQRKKEALLAVIAKLREFDMLPLECAIFELRVTFREAAYPQALQISEKILARSGDNIEALRVGGRIGNLLRDDDVALRYWERLAKAAPNDPEAALQASRIQLRRGQYVSALAYAQQAAERQPGSAEPLQIAVSAGLEIGWPEGCDPLLAGLFTANHPRALAALSRLVNDLDSEQAARLLSYLQQRVTSDSALADIAAKAYSGWLVSALERELASRELDAASLYRSARTVQPCDVNAQRALDRLTSPNLLAMREAFDSRDFPNAIEHGLMATRINPDCLEAWQAIGRAQFTLGNIAEASEAFNQCTKLNPRDANSWLMYGVALNHAGERRPALFAFQKARELTDSEVKKEAEASIAALHPLLVRDAQQAATEGNLDLAWEATDAALGIRPEDAVLAQLQKNLLRRQKQQIQDAWNTSSDSVATLCRRYLEKAAGDPYVSTVLARTLMRTRAYADALPVWENLSRQSPDDSHNHLQIARCCRVLRVRERGLVAAETALRLDPALREAAEVADFLMGLPPSGTEHGAALSHARP